MKNVKSFTLVELMVAVALMVILTGSVVFIFARSQEIFLKVDARVQVYQYARYAFDQMERDLANVVQTHNMEFFDDLPDPALIKGRYDNLNEQVPIRGKDNPDTYHYAFTARQHQPYPSFEDEQSRYRWDSIYFKTVTEVAGETQPVLVEYALIDRDQRRPRLVKRTWQVTGTDARSPFRPRHVINGDEHPRPQEHDLALYAVDSRFELFVRNRRWQDVGDFYSVEELINPPRVPTQGGNTRLPFPPHQDVFRGLDTTTPVVNPNTNERNDYGGSHMVMCYYDQDHDKRVGVQPDLGVFEWSTDEKLKGLFKTKRNFAFPMLREGSIMSISGGGLVAKDYTVKAFVKPDGTPFEPGDPPSSFRIKFEEDLEWPQGQQNRDLEVRYMTSWLPPAVRVSLKIKDSKSQEVRSVQRVFKLLGAN